MKLVLKVDRDAPGKGARGIQGAIETAAIGGYVGAAPQLQRAHPDRGGGGGWGRGASLCEAIHARQAAGQVQQESCRRGDPAMRYLFLSGRHDPGECTQSSMRRKSWAGGR